MQVLLEKGRDGEDLLVFKPETPEDFVTLQHLYKIGFMGAQLLLTPFARHIGADSRSIVLLSYVAQRIEPDDLK